MCGIKKFMSFNKKNNALIYSAYLFYFWSFEIMEYILRTQKLSYVKIHFRNKFEIFWYFSTYQSLRRLPLLKITVFSSESICQHYRVTDEALIAETMVWPNFFLMNVFFALKESQVLLLFLITAAGCCAVWRP